MLLRRRFLAGWIGFTLVAVSAAVVVSTSGPARAQSPLTSSYPSAVRMGVDSTCCFDVVVRDAANNPIAGTLVVVDFGASTIDYCPGQPHVGNTVQLSTNAFGQATFCICASIPTGMCTAKVSAGGVEQCSMQAVDCDLEIPVAPSEIRLRQTFDSGSLANDTGSPAVVFQNDVEIAGVPWCRAYFSAIELPPGSTLRVTSLLDNQVHELDRFTAEIWGNTTGYLRGDKIRIQLVAAPQTTGNRVALEYIGTHKTNDVNCGVNRCHPWTPDTRVPSNEDWSGRWLQGGCTASVFNRNGCYVSAAHCPTVANVTVLSFRNPLSLNDCTPDVPDLVHQFPVIATTADETSPCMTDWRVGKLGVNNLGETHYQRYGVFKPLASGPPPVSSTVDLYAFGGSKMPVFHMIQQRTTSTVLGNSTNSIVVTGGTVTAGTSGGGWLYNDAIVGINVCCGTIVSRIDQPAFVAARQQMCPHTVHAPWDAPFCHNDPQVTVSITLCNTSGAPDSYQLSFAQAPAGPMCSVAGPTSFTVVGPNPVGSIPDGQCQSVQVVIGRPAGFSATGLTACYDVTATSSNTGTAVTERGSVQDRRDLCPEMVMDPATMTVGETRTIRFTVRNDAVPSGIFNYRVEAFGPDMEPTGAISLGGNYFGVATDGAANIPLGSTGEIAVDVRYRWLESFDISDLVVSTDIDGDSVREPLVSVGARSVLAGASVPSVPGASLIALSLILGGSAVYSLARRRPKTT